MTGESTELVAVLRSRGRNNSLHDIERAAQALTNQAERIKTLETALRDCIDVLDIADAYGFYAPGSLGAADVKDTRDQARKALSALQGGDHAG